MTMENKPQEQTIVPAAKPAEGEQAKPQVTIEELQKQLNQLQESLKQKDEVIKKTEDNWKSEQRVSSKHVNEVARYKAELEDRRADREFQKLLIASIAELKGQDEQAFSTDVNKRKDDLLNRFTQVEQQQEFARKQREAQAKTTEYQQKVGELGLTDKDVDYWQIKEMVVSGNYELADLRMASIEKTRQPSPPKTLEAPKNPDKTVDQLADEKAKVLYKKYLTDNGLLQQDTGAPEAPATEAALMNRKYANGEITSDQFSQWKRKHSGG